jgi:hypothetical protein
VTDGIDSDRLLICEGPEDHCFIRNLRDRRGLPAFHAKHIAEAPGGAGYQALAGALTAFSVMRGFRRNVRRLAILIDADDDPAQRFEEVRQLIAKANQHPDSLALFPEPLAPLAPVTRGQLTLTVMQIPGNGALGCLETLVWSSLMRLYPTETACVDSLIACSGVEAGPKPWSASKVAKAKVRAALAILYRKDPSVPLSRLWTRAPDVIPSTEAEFNDLAAALESF